MAKNMKPKVFKSWSFTRLQDFRQCPLKAKLKHLDKVQEPPNDAMARGSAIHEAAENYIKGKLKVLPNDLVRFKGEFESLKKLYKKKIQGAIVEDNWCFTNAWTQTRFDDWVGCWVRIKLDCAHFTETGGLVVTDWKTGKFRDDVVAEYMEQLELYCLAALLMHPHIPFVTARLVFLDHGVIYPPATADDKQLVVVNTPAEIARLKKKWEKAVKPMMNATNFPAKPNNKCRWCHYRKDNAANGGGQCAY